MTWKMLHAKNGSAPQILYDPNLDREVEPRGCWNLAEKRKTIIQNEKHGLLPKNGFCYMQADKAGVCRVMPRLVKY